jgi:hypothetical protein
MLLWLRPLCAQAPSVDAGGEAASAAAVVASAVTAMPELMDVQEGDIKQDAATATRQEPHSAWQELLYYALHANVPSSSFACSGRLQPPFLCPDIYVEGEQLVAPPPCLELCAAVVLSTREFTLLQHGTASHLLECTLSDSASCLAQQYCVPEMICSAWFQH